MKYCLDSGCLIEPWNKFYSPKICPTFWDVLANLSYERKEIFVPAMVADEIRAQDDELNDWLHKRAYMIRQISPEVQSLLKTILENPTHQRLVDSTKNRSKADPWVIAHAMHENATVVTTETFALDANKKIKIPNVCRDLGVECIGIFEFVSRMGIEFTCTQIKKE